MEKSQKTKLLFTIAEIGLFLGAIYAAHKGGEQVEKKRKELQEEGKELETIDIVKSHIPTAVLGTAAVGVAVANYKLSAREVALLTASAAYLTKERDQIERKLREVVGDEKVDAVKEKIALKNIASLPKKGIINKKISAEETGYGDELFYDVYSGRLFRSSLKEVDAGITRFKLYREGYDFTDVNEVCYNDYFNELHIRTTTWGENVGWTSPLNDPYVDPEITFEVKKVTLDDIRNNSSKLDENWISELNEDIYLIILSDYFHPTEGYNNY